MLHAATRQALRAARLLRNGQRNYDVMMMMVMMMMVVMMPVVMMMVVVVMTIIGSGDDHLRELERVASALLLRPKRVHGVRNGFQQFRKGLRGLDARIGRGGSGGEGAAAAHKGERRGAPKKSKHRFVHGVSFLDRDQAKRGLDRLCSKCRHDRAKGWQRFTSQPAAACP
jgi:hypothetical protein